jgi:hypothetical protein
LISSTVASPRSPGDSAQSQVTTVIDLDACETPCVRRFTVEVEPRLAAPAADVEIGYQLRAEDVNAASTVEELTGFVSLELVP